jgi:hypothetical protein
VDAVVTAFTNALNLTSYGGGKVKIAWEHFCLFFVLPFWHKNFP